MPAIPILAPTIDIVEIGAGGGSIAWVDNAGALKVGPVSAGADPGPACYGRGGDQAHRDRRQRAGGSHQPATTSWVAKSIWTWTIPGAP